MAAVVDLSLPVEECAAALYRVCTTSGFAVLTNHGVPQSTIDGMFDASRRFFALPMEVKRKALATESPHNRGYSPPNEQKLDAAAARADTKEGYYIGRELPVSDTNPLQGPNAWPDEALVPGFRSAMATYFGEVLALGDRMLERLALALGLPQGWFADKFDRSIATLRPLHYSATDDPGEIGAGAHTDFGCITLLTTDDQPGLQVGSLIGKPPTVKVKLLLGGEWVSVPPAPGCFVMNIGDMLERWSNGKFKSTMHRVLNTGAERYSTAFFIDANYDAVVECLPTCTGPDNPPKYAPVLAGHHLMSRLRGTHTQHALEGPHPGSAASA